MTLAVRFWLLLQLLVFISFSALAQNVKLAVGWSKPPFVISDNNFGNSSGIELDIVREALSHKDYSLQFISMPLGRTAQSLASENIDGSLTLPNDFKHQTTYLSAPYITYQNIAVTLKQENITLASIADLSDFSLIAFQNAGRYLGQEYADAVLLNNTYSELPNQQSQVQMLFKRRTQAIVIDINIFKYIRKQIKSEESLQGVVFHYLFPENHYRVGFKSPQIRDDFNHGLQQLKSSGRHQEIVDSYIN